MMDITNPMLLDLVMSVIDLSHGFLVQSDELHIADDARLGTALGDDRRASLHGPRQRDCTRG